MHGNGNCPYFLKIHELAYILQGVPYDSYEQVLNNNKIAPKKIN